MKNTLVFRRNRLLLAAVFVAIPSASLFAQRFRATLPAWQSTILMDTLRQDTTLKAAPAAVYKAAVAAFKELGIPILDSSATTGLVANGKMQTMHAFAGSLMSHSFDCGQTGTVPSADSFRMQLAVAVYIDAAPGGGTRLGVAAAASGKDPTGTSPAPRACNSTGNLETKITNVIAKKSGS
jgi:hypothetical protein